MKAQDPITTQLETAHYIPGFIRLSVQTSYSMNSMDEEERPFSSGTWRVDLFI